MKKTLIFILALVLSCSPVFAQHENAVLKRIDSTRVSLNPEMSKDLGSENDIVKVSFRNNDHWFMDAMGGVGFYAAEANRINRNFCSRMYPQGQIGFGKWIHPAWAFRLSAGAGKFENHYLTHMFWNMYERVDHNITPEAAKPFYYTDEKGCSWFHRSFNYVDLGMDLMYDLTRNFIQDIATPFDLYLYGGTGFEYALPSQGFSANNSVSFRLGGQMDIHLTDVLGLKFQVQGTIVSESLDGKIGGRSGVFNLPLEGFATVMAGISIRFSRQKPDRYVKVNPVIVERVYNTIPIAVERHQYDYDEFKAPFVVRFYIDQYNIEADQELNITKVCTYLEQHPKARLLMTGHCDPETANPIYNQALSERRCKSVLDYIDAHFNIDHSRIDVKPMGDTQKNFDEDFRWNRCVLLTIVED